MRHPLPPPAKSYLQLIRKSQPNSNDSQFSLEPDPGVVLMRRSTRFLPDGAYLFEDHLEVQGVLTARVITCAAWLLELYELKAGEAFYISGAERVQPATKRFGVLYPPSPYQNLASKMPRAIW